MAKLHEVLEFKEQLSASHFEAPKIITRAENKRVDLTSITKNTHQALHELADCFVHRETLAKLMGRETCRTRSEYHRKHLTV
jgi:hypothetical protein